MEMACETSGYVSPFRTSFFCLHWLKEEAAVAVSHLAGAAGVGGTGLAFVVTPQFSHSLRTGPPFQQYRRLGM